MASRSLAAQPPRTKLLLGLLAGVQIALVGVAHWDLSHRNEAQLRGSKTTWRYITLIAYVGPIWYFLRGRR